MRWGRLSLGLLLTLTGAVLVAPFVILAGWSLQGASLVAVAPGVIPVAVAMVAAGPVLIILGVRIALTARTKGSSDP